jgi:hypothetical protein
MTLMGEGAIWRSSDGTLGYLPDCGGPPSNAILGAMSKTLSPSQILRYVLLRLLLLGPALTAVVDVTACTRVATAAAHPNLPQVTAAKAVAREVTEWDEFTGRLEPVSSRT